MAPEQCDPERFGEIGPASDVWGLGATLYEALSGQQAFGPDGGDRYPQLRRDPPAIPTKAPPVLAAAVRASLQRDPASRPTAADLDDLLEGLADWSSRAIRRLR
jgi:serine/threonine protein kinase